MKVYLFLNSYSICKEHLLRGTHVLVSIVKTLRHSLKHSFLSSGHLSWGNSAQSECLIPIHISTAHHIDHCQFSVASTHIKK